MLWDIDNEYVQNNSNKKKFAYSCNSYFELKQMN